MGVWMFRNLGLIRNTARLWQVVFVILCLVALGPAAEAKTIKIYALGASNTNGKGVSSSEAWPAQLEQKLRAKGYDV
jgi:acyl-CoA thioesterase-1